MKYEVFEDEHYYVCHDGRELRHIRTEKKEQDGYTQTIEVYDVQTAADVNINQNVCIDIMKKKIQTGRK